MKHLIKKLSLSFILLSVSYTINVLADDSNAPSLTDQQIDQAIIGGTIPAATLTPVPASNNQANAAAGGTDDEDNDGIANENDPDADNDGITNDNDPDDDNDGVADVDDAYPYDPARAVMAKEIIDNNSTGDRRR